MASSEAQLLCDRQAGRRGSKSQLCLLRILHIISTVPPVLVAENDGGGDGNQRGLPEAGESLSAGFSGLTAEREVEVDFDDGGDRIGQGEKEEREIRVSESPNRSLNLLIEAAELVFGEFGGNGNSEPEWEPDNVNRSVSSGSNSKKEAHSPEKMELRSRNRVSEIAGYFEEAPSRPVVRSKRGRAQVLPYKYRDSVLEPLAGVCKQGLSILPAKRRPR